MDMDADNNSPFSENGRMRIFTRSFNGYVSHCCTRTHIFQMLNLIKIDAVYFAPLHTIRVCRWELYQNQPNKQFYIMHNSKQKYLCTDNGEIHSINTIRNGSTTKTANICIVEENQFPAEPEFFLNAVASLRYNPYVDDILRISSTFHFGHDTVNFKTNNPLKILESTYFLFS